MSEGGPKSYEAPSIKQREASAEELDFAKKQKKERLDSLLESLREKTKPGWWRNSDTAETVYGEIVELKNKYSEELQDVDHPFRALVTNVYEELINARSILVNAQARVNTDKYVERFDHNRFSDVTEAEVENLKQLESRVGGLMAEISEGIDWENFILTHRVVDLHVYVKTAPIYSHLANATLFKSIFAEGLLYGETGKLALPLDVKLEDPEYHWLRGNPESANSIGGMQGQGGSYYDYIERLKKDPKFYRDYVIKHGRVARIPNLDGGPEFDVETMSEEDFNYVTDNPPVDGKIDAKSIRLIAGALRKSARLPTGIGGLAINILFKERPNHGPSHPNAELLPHSMDNILGVVCSSNKIVREVLADMLEVTKNVPQLRVPIYDMDGNLLWPKKLGHMELEATIIEQGRQSEKAREVFDGLKRKGWKTADDVRELELIPESDFDSKLEKLVSRSLELESKLESLRRDAHLSINAGGEGLSKRTSEEFKHANEELEWLKKTVWIHPEFPALLSPSVVMNLQLESKRAKKQQGL